MSVVTTTGVAWPAVALPQAAVDAWVELCSAVDAMTGEPPCSLDPEMWFVGAQSPRLARAVAACSRCPVLYLCRAYAVAADEREGVWGGTTPADRRGS